MEFCCSKGLVFIVESDTEKVFYLEYLTWLCDKLEYSIEKDEVSQEDLHIINTSSGQVVVMFWSSNSVSNIVRGSIWFKHACVEGYPNISWTVFLCYDTDEYDAPISKFHEGDWASLCYDIERDSVSVVDMAAEADIEDIMLCDLESVLTYLGLPADTEIPPGNKGKTKLKKLYRMVAKNNTYHSGSRARPLIRALDMDVLRRCAPVPLKKIDEALGEGI